MSACVNHCFSCPCDPIFEMALIGSRFVVQSIVSPEPGLELLILRGIVCVHMLNTECSCCVWMKTPRHCCYCCACRTRGVIQLILVTHGVSTGWQGSTFACVFFLDSRKENLNRELLGIPIVHRWPSQPYCSSLEYQYLASGEMPSLVTLFTWF